MKKLIIKNLIVLSTLIFTSAILRLIFYFSLRNQFKNVDFLTILNSFIHGMRFDLSAILYLNTLFFLLICVEKIRLSHFTAILFALINSLYVALNLSDIYFYLAYGKKVGRSFLTAILGTKGEILYSMLRFYGVIILALFFSFILFYFFQKTIFSKYKTNFTSKKYIIYLSLVILLSLLGIRGGLQKRVLSPQHTMLYAKGFTAVEHMTSNTVHNLIREKKSHYFHKNFESKSLIDDTFSNVNFSSLDLVKKPKNVLFIFVESLSAYFTEKKDFLNDQRNKEKKDYIFTKNLYATGELSLDALASVLFGVPSYFNLHIFNSKYTQNKWIGLSTVLKEKGFSSFFIHGATKGVQFFDIIASASGVDDFYSIKDGYSAPKNMLAPWGVHDEFLYKKSKKIISKYKKPFVGSIFTTSSHTPFKGTPNNVNGKGSLEADYFASISYANKALESFFKSIKNESWFKETLFIITGDHSPPILTDWNINPKYASRLPLLMYFPESRIGELTYNKRAQHIDLPLTVFQLLNVRPKHWSPFGRSIFEKREAGELFFTNNKTINLITQSGILKTSTNNSNKKDTIFSFNEANKPLHELNWDKELKKTTNIIKDYVYRLKHNQFYKN